MDRLSQELLAKILALRNGQAEGYFNQDTGRFEQAGSAPTYYGSGDLQGYNVNDTGIAFDTGDGYTNNFETDGTYRDRTANRGGNYNAMRIAKMAAAAAAAYGGASLLNGSGLLGGAGSSAATDGALAAGGFGDGGMSLFGSPLTNPAAAEAFAGAGGFPGFSLTPGFDLGNAVQAGGFGSAGDLAKAANVASAASPPVDGVGSIGKTLATVAGGVAGAADAKDSKDVTSRDPWEPAQPFLKSLLGDGQALYSRYMAEPFSPQQKQAYNNFGGLLNTINANAGGLLSGFGANASGANQYSRGRGPLTGSSFDMGSFKPGALSFFGG